MRSILDWLFGCKHKNWSAPFTPIRILGKKKFQGQTYRICLDCGQPRVYDWKSMKWGVWLPKHQIENIASMKLVEDLKGEVNVESDEFIPGIHNI